MPRFRILTVDPDPAARLRLRRLLMLESDCELTGECSDGREAENALSTFQPDIVFLSADAGLAAETIPARPFVILTSGRGASVCEGFASLTKPFSIRRFREVLERARFVVTRRRETPRRIAVRNKGRITFVRLQDVDWIEAADNYVCLHCGTVTHVVRETMKELESKLDAASFLRVHRSAIVNLDRVRELQPWFRGEYRLVLIDGTTLNLTKNYRATLEASLIRGTAC